MQCLCGDQSIGRIDEVGYKIEKNTVWKPVGSSTVLLPFGRLFWKRSRVSSEKESKTEVRREAPELPDFRPVDFR